VATASYANILEKYDRFRSLCAALSLAAEVEGGRFGLYAGRIRHLSAQMQRIRDGEPEGPVLVQLAPDLPRYLAALAETREAGAMVPFLTACPRELTAPRLRAMLAGPELPVEENQASNQARNIQFELFLATLLSGVGISVTLGEPDLRCKVDGLTALIACKRLFSVRKLNKRINEATLQLSRQLASLPQAWGVVAISLSRVLAVTDRSEAINNQSEGLHKLDLRIKGLVERRARWRQTREAQAILFQLSSIFTNAATAKIELGGFTTMYGTGPVCEKLAIRIQRIEDGVQ